MASTFTTLKELEDLHKLLNDTYDVNKERCDRLVVWLLDLGKDCPQRGGLRIIHAFGQADTMASPFTALKELEDLQKLLNNNKTMLAS